MKNGLNIHIYDARDGFRWHAKRGGRIVAESGEGYVKRSSAVKAAQNLVAVIQAKNVVVHTDRQAETVGRAFGSKV